MADSSTLIQTEFQNLLKAVAFDGISADDVVIRELPTSNDSPVDNTPAIFIAPHGDYGQTPMGFGGPFEIVHGIEVCLIDKTLGQYGVDQAKRQQWQELACRTILRDGVEYRRLNVADFYDMENVPNAVFDRSKLADNYSYSSVLFKVKTLG